MDELETLLRKRKADYLLKILAIDTLLDEKISPKPTETPLPKEPDIMDLTPIKITNIKQLLSHINKKHNVDIRVKSRLPNIVKARNEFFFEAKNLNYVYEDIGKFLGMSHCNAMHGCNKHRKDNNIKISFAGKMKANKSHLN